MTASIRRTGGLLAGAVLLAVAAGCGPASHSVKPPSAVTSQATPSGAQEGTSGSAVTRSATPDQDLTGIDQQLKQADDDLKSAGDGLSSTQEGDVG